MRIIRQKDRNYNLFRLFNSKKQRSCEVAYLSLRPKGLEFSIEFPSDWHEQARVWIRISLGLFAFAFSFPWKWVVPDNYQCSGPRYGFAFFDDMLLIYYGKDTGCSKDPKRSKAIYMPWHWRHVRHDILSDKSEYLYSYRRTNGEIQSRIATINIEEREWNRTFWFPRKKVNKYINVEFNLEIGEKVGSWKGGTVGCSYDMLPGEDEYDTLKRMEKERKF